MAMTMPAMAVTQEDVMDIDIDMDIDGIGPAIDENDILEEGEEPQDYIPQHQMQQQTRSDVNEIVPAVYLEDPAEEPAWEKVHLRGVDDLSTDNIRTFASDFFSDADPFVQWVDDTSVNLCYKDRSTARQAFLSFLASQVESSHIDADPFVMHTAKPLITRPASILTIRVAKQGDRKKKGAKDASRYYLMHPEADPDERIRRQRENGDYTRRRFDTREHNRRKRHQDEDSSTNDFAASMYDDTPTSQPRGRDLFSRITKPHRRRSASPTIDADAIALSDSEDDPQPKRRKNGYRKRESPPPRLHNAGRELFSDHEDSSSRMQGMRSENTDLFPQKAHRSDKPRYEANQGVARQIKADLLAATQSSSPGARSHRRTRAIDTRVEEDLAERFGRKSLSLDSTKSVGQKTGNSGKELFEIGVGSGMSIKGAGSGSGQGLAIKGRGESVKELFPDKFASGGSSGARVNAGRELFGEGGGGRRRQRAGDLFD